MRIKKALAESESSDLNVSVPSAQTLLQPKMLHNLLAADVVLRVGYRPGSQSTRGRLFDLVWQALRTLNSARSYGVYWIGTDVLDTLRDCRERNLTRAFSVSLTHNWHIAGSQRLVDELAEVGIDASHVSIPMARKKVRYPRPLGRAFKVLTYIPEARPTFYGAQMILAVAQQLPTVHFDVVAGSGHWLRSPAPNLHFHGWQGNMQDWYDEASVVVRMVEHDSVGGTVIEGLLHGRHVIYSYPHEHCTHVTFGDVAGLRDALSHLQKMHEAGCLGPNFQGWEYARKEYDAGDISRKFENTIRLRHKCK